MGTTIRFFDSKAGKWRVVFVDPTTRAIRVLSGGAVDGRIVLEGISDDGSQIRWSFNDITRDSFVWRGEKSRDGGKTWRLWAEYHLKRESAAAFRAAPENQQNFCRKNPGNPYVREIIVPKLKKLGLKQ